MNEEKIEKRNALFKWSHDRIENAETFINKWYYYTFAECQNRYFYNEYFRDFWIDLLKYVLGIDDIEELINFDYKGLFAYIPSMNVVLDYNRGIIEDEDGKIISSLHLTEEKIDQFADNRYVVKVLFDYEAFYIYDERLLNAQVVSYGHLKKDYDKLLYVFNKAIFKFQLYRLNAYLYDFDEIQILDSKTYNVLIKYHQKEYARTLSKEALDEIKKLTDKYMDLINGEIEYPSGLDENETEYEYKIRIMNKKQKIDITTYNLWYYNTRKPKDDNTRYLIEYIKKIQKILKEDDDTPYDMLTKNRFIGDHVTEFTANILNN